MPLFTNHHTMHINTHRTLCPEPLCPQFRSAACQCQHSSNQGKYYVALFLSSASKKAHGPQYKFWDLGMHPCNTLPPAQQNIAHQNTAPPLTPPPSTQMATARPPPCPSAKCLSCTHPGNAQGVMRHCKVCCHGLATSHCKIHETRPPTPPALTKSSTPVLLKLLPPSQPCSERKLAFCTNKLSMFQNFYTFTFS
ncbi:hypothetical protein DFH08DRAFT_976317 [Mycena albidolilacea]|uniref:Uncharacterized protein n=1 Tax=Mycena albidolilacea TaxID=1033008 RepID=A0AAD7EAF9_9AGAR|nr:hypothetical protein DFH08DRAFT_976317 [Mycena albidolilacea]